MKHLPDSLLSKLRLDKKLLLNVDPEKLRHLSIKQIHVRNVAGFANQMNYRLRGLVKTLILPVKLVAECIYHFTMGIFALLRALLVKTPESYQRVKMRMRMAFMIAPLICAITPLEILSPATFLKLESRLAAMA